MSNEKTWVESRRLFLRRAGVAAVALPFLPLAAGSCGGEATATKASAPGAAAPQTADDAPADVSWQARLASKDEPGEPMSLSGTVYLPDGRTPAEGVLVYAYHTDARGLYASRPGDHEHGRLRGWMRTDARGRYELTSIRPASYPNSDNPQHVHVAISGPRIPVRLVDTFWFADDPLIGERQRSQYADRGDFSPLIRLTRGGDGLWRGTRNVRLETVAS